MKLEAGKYYRTRDGRKAYVTAVELPWPDGRSTEHPVSGCVLNLNQYWVGDSWSMSGSVWIHDKDYQRDLVAEWTDENTELKPSNP